MIDASKGFIKDGNKNRLRAQDIHRIVDTFTRQLEVPRYSRMVPLTEITDPKNDYNLNLPRYIDSTEPEDVQDIDAHLRGGIPNRDLDALDRYWQVFPSLRSLLFEPAGRDGYSQLRVESGQLTANGAAPLSTIHYQLSIKQHAEFTAFNHSVTALFANWKRANIPHLQSISVGDKPKVLIEMLAEDLLETFRKAHLIDPYDVYQHLMDYWAETMQDDVYLLVQEGWKAMLNSKPNSDLIPQSLIIARYFTKEQAAIEQLEADRDAITRQLEELDEEHGGEEGLLAEAKTDKGKLTAKSIKDRLAAIKGDKDAHDERKVLENYLVLLEQESEAGRKVKDAQKALDAKVAAKYGHLSKDEIKTLVVDDKWLATLTADVQSELDRVSQALTGRIRELADRYAAPLPKLIKEVACLTARVDEHLKKMGFSNG
jgi:type I restriction enzyme M protein